MPPFVCRSLRATESTLKKQNFSCQNKGYQLEIGRGVLFTHTPSAPEAESKGQTCISILLVSNSQLLETVSVTLNFVLLRRWSFTTQPTLAPNSRQQSPVSAGSTGTVGLAYCILFTTLSSSQISGSPPCLAIGHLKLCAMFYFSLCSRIPCPLASHNFPTSPCSPELSL